MSVSFIIIVHLPVSLYPDFRYNPFVMKSIVLASKSPRRKELLASCGVPFTADAAEIDETLRKDCPLPEAVQELSLRKAEAVLKRHPSSIIIGSDTIVAVDGEVLGKPHSREDAVLMLKKLSGRTHQVITGLAVISSVRTFQTVTVSDVTFIPLSEEEIRTYTATGEADDKAGAYGIQGLAGKFISHIDGDYYSIVGLPLSLVYRELKNSEMY